MNESCEWVLGRGNDCYGGLIYSLEVHVCVFDGCNCWKKSLKSKSPKLFNID